ncbi:MAG: hypothetical protein QF926_08910 [Alphaproteobacteria bacterium]|jgi:hypothetical protein|nr:hypothetical protein [Alphaproteobacteria bacterium]MDP6516725.1 hypothetical protein [Alphaproteobacteria bacterium]
MRFSTTIVAAALALAIAGTAPAAADGTINAEILNFSEMDRWVTVTDMVCGTELFKEKMGAQARAPVELRAGEDGKGKVRLYVRVGCSKNWTFDKVGIENGATVQF